MEDLPLISIYSGTTNKDKLYNVKYFQRKSLTPTTWCPSTYLSSFRIVQKFAERFKSAFLLRWQVIVIGILRFIHGCFCRIVRFYFLFSGREQKVLTLEFLCKRSSFSFSKTGDRPCQIWSWDIYFPMRRRWNTLNFVNKSV